MTHLAPGAVHALVGVDQVLHETVPSRVRVAMDQALDHGAVFDQQRIDSGRDVLGFKFGKTRQTGKIE